MSGKPKLILHVGSHKTGTTSIQDALAANREWLARNGVYYPNPKPFFFRKSDAHHDLAHALAGGSARQHTGAKRFHAHLLEASRQHDRIVLSAEPFYRHVAAETASDKEIAGEEDDDSLTEDELVLLRRKYVSGVAEYFADFDVEIVLFLRRQDSFAESLYRSAVVSTTYAGGFKRYVSRKTFRFDYRTQKAIFSEHFPQVTTISYEGSLAKGLVPTFFERLGLDRPASLPAEREYLRRSLSNKAILWIDRSKLEDGLTRSEVQRRWHFSILPDSAFLSGRNSTLWGSAAERQQFMERYRDPEIEGMFPPIEADTRDEASLTDEEFAHANARFLEWERTNAEYLARRERRRIPPYRVDQPAQAEHRSMPGTAKAESRDSGALAAICCTTRHRPRMLSDLLASWAQLKIPDGIEPVFIVVENDELAPSENIVEWAQADFAAGRLIYAVEPEVGIPHARNAAIQVALDQGAELVAFVDDDETVSPDWFAKLYEAHVRSGAQLIGGPVRAAASEPYKDLYRRVVQKGISERYRHVERKALARLRRGQLNRLAILTNNWLAHADLFTKHGLRFDQHLRYSGGSDTKFFRDAVAKGVRTDWAPDAIVFETVPSERVSLAYQYKRGRDQSKTSIRAKVSREGHWRVLPLLLTSVAVRSVGTGLLFVAIPLTGGKTLVRFTRSCGWIVGRFAGFFGQQSHLYRQITGD